MKKYLHDFASTKAGGKSMIDCQTKENYAQKNDHDHYENMNEDNQETYENEDNDEEQNYIGKNRSI